MDLPDNLRIKLANVSNLPSPSRVALAIMELARDPDMNLGAVAGLINKDPALASKILRTANSALFTQRRRSDSLRKALIVLGLNATLTLALSFSLVNSFRKQDVDGINLPLFWRNCLLSATAARVTGEVLGRTDTEDLFLAGLLQDLGVLAIDKAIPGFYHASTDDGFDHDRLCRYEIEKTGVDHAVIGAWLMNRWKMPERLVDAVSVSHQREVLHDDMFNACVAMSQPIAAFCTAEPADGSIAALTALFATTTGRGPETLSEILLKIEKQARDIEWLYESELIDSAQAELILDQAREILMLRNLQALRSAETRTNELEEMNRRDPLTGVFNRSHMIQVLEQEFDTCIKNDWHMSICFIDVDKFKSINDTEGHIAGDRLLASVAAALVEKFRESDIVTRYGGDEFVIVMPGADTAMAVAACARIAESFGKLKHELGDGKLISVTLSMGLASVNGDSQFETVEDLLSAADAAVYAVKQNGRNGYAHWSDLSRTGLAKAAPARDYRSPETLNA